MTEISPFIDWLKVEYIVTYYLDSIIGSINKNLVWIRF